MKLNTHKLALTGILVALGVILSPYHVPIGLTKCYPWQHLINVISAILLGPVYAVGQAFTVSLLRNLLGMGTLFAFPGSLFGALLASLLYMRYGKTYLAALGECIGTGVIGAMVATPVANLFMGKEATLFAFIIPFMISSFVGAVLAVCIFQLTGIKRIVLAKERYLS
ncbi:energy coupling factor transporter S component ThiW [Vallitalea pronyensis]|uniref:Energy coupling factor transporter S component ThiW n=1 Tax=Vallitalea pronyensis TaxID=1348613 RepID=A0A8J8MKN6_9FIRM|nr:energy coupling factor transporter S component ThiW [Vallitalea pronyensis]QUI23286.1 energy coupling factor transporter S component ThiW [Vallitalea pronyensis]